MANSRIEWTGSTWNPATGCTKVSAGCTNCYAEKMALRLKSMKVEKYSNGFNFTVHEEALKEPYGWKKPKMVFVNSMSDLFHEKMPFNFLKKVFNVMNENQIHTFQLLTKRANSLAIYSETLKWTNNIWMGVSIEDFTQLERLNLLKSTQAKIKFLSIEPLLTELPEIDLSGIDWVIVGGESGPNARPIKEEWVLKIKDNCRKYDVPFFFKQWGGKNKKKSGRLLNGKTYDEMPVPKIKSSTY
ncbi:DUF5131 family protein [Saccharicrinis sp. FJH2]|uniref:DUF5131 family protein n=1 Tax=Saccharicrinis sp. FJH65 TaxID=3344659 RepID=UPI0035F38B87